MKKLYIISGCNGAGKTTASYTILPDMLSCKEFVNADEIAKGLSPFNPNEMSIKAGRLMLNRINELIIDEKDFAFETTLSTRSYVKTIKRAKEKGFFVTLLYFWLNTPELAIERVKNRVMEGGHNIPVEIIKRRYHSGLKNLFNLYIPVTDYWLLIDNSDISFRIIAEGDNNNLSIKINSVWNKLKNEYHGN